MDVALVAAARAGSDAAFARLVAAHQAPLRAFLRRTLGGFDLADDVAQETFVAAWTSLGRLKDPARFRPWLFGIAWKKAQDALRSGLRDQARGRAWVEVSEASAGISPEDRMALEAAVGDLPTDQRACIALCLADGFSHQEAASILGLPLGTVKSHVTRGRTRLLAALTGEPHDV
ncbi:RNA polymerase sigma factor [Brevundimonas bacteroides]|uniref:RNA polymerase sigma factor n=1 Tax=Brevundimonas bacteroides TaxID=74311 RepID=UPI000497F7DA|nr:RNA polymerase sigma factor [Brevundimonas bacteroides]